MIICDNLNIHSFDVSFISPEGSLSRLVAPSSKWSTTSLTTIRHLYKFISREFNFNTFDDTLCNHLEEYINITVITYRFTDNDKMSFVMFKRDDPEKHLFIETIKQEIKRRNKHDNTIKRNTTV